MVFGFLVGGTTVAKRMRLEVHLRTTLLILLVLLLAPTAAAQQPSAVPEAAEAPKAPKAAEADAEGETKPAAQPDASAEPALAPEGSAAPAEETVGADKGADEEAKAEAPAPSATGSGPISDQAKDLYLQKCASCHTIGEGPRVGPDLKGVHERRDAAWLKTMIQTPSRLLDSDPVARKLLAEFKNVRMQDLGLTDEQVALLVEVITVCSAQKCDLKGKFVAVTEATPADVKLGLDLFMGIVPQENGGPACISCHTLEGATGILGGGTLAKEVTHSFATLGDEGLDAALKNPNFPLMKEVYADKPLKASEVFALRAALYEANRGALSESGAQVSVILVALLAAVLSLLGLNAAWSKRSRGVRTALVAKKEQQA